MTRSALTGRASSPACQVRKTPRLRTRAPNNGENCSSNSNASEGEASRTPCCTRKGLMEDLNVPLPDLHRLGGSEGDCADRPRTTLSSPMLEAHDFVAPPWDMHVVSHQSSIEQLTIQRDLNGAVAMLVQQNKAQAKAIEELRMKWACWHDELEERVCDLERSTRVHQGILAEFLGRGAVPRLHGGNSQGSGGSSHWEELKEIIKEQRNELSCLRNIVSAQRDAVLSAGVGLKCSPDPEGNESLPAEGSPEWDDGAYLSASHLSWIEKVFSWSSAVDELPVVELGSDDPTVSAGRSSGSASAEEAEAEPDGTADVEVAVQHGLHAVLVQGPGTLSVEAQQDAEGFCTFISGASLEQRSWMRTLATFAVTAAPLSALTSATTLKLRLLDQAVCLPGTNLLLLVAQSAEPLPVAGKDGAGESTSKADLRVLSVLSLTSVIERGLCVSALSTDTVLHVSAFEAFCLSVENRDEDALAGDTKPVLLAVCSLRDFEIVGHATDATSCVDAARMETGSSGSGGESRSRSASPHSPEPRRRDNRSLGNGASGCGVNGSEKRYNKESTSSWGMNPTERTIVGRWISSAKRRKMPIPADREDESVGLRQDCLAVVGKACLSSNHQSSLVPPPERPGEARRPSLPSGALLQMDDRDKVQGPVSCSSSTESTCSTASSDSGYRLSRLANPGAQRGRQDRCPDGIRSELRHRGGCSPLCSVAGGSAAAGGDAAGRRGAIAAIRCSGVAAQKEQQDLWVQLPRVRAVVPKAVRNQLPSFECEECAAFFELVGGDVADFPCTHGEARGDCSAACAPSGFRPNIRSRHKAFVQPSSTPPGYWDL